MASSTTNCYEIDNTFSYYAQGCRGGFDFTLLFEQTILTALPLGLFVLVAPARIWYLLKRPKKTTTSFLLPLKVVRLKKPRNFGSQKRKERKTKINMF